MLYIEDNPVNVLLMEAMLARVPGLRVVTAPLPGLGLQMARDERPDLILLDIQLPGMDGYEVLRRLRADPKTRAVPVIAVSANAMPSDVDRGLAAGFADYLTKPIDMSRLIASVEGVLLAMRRLPDVTRSLDAAPGLVLAVAQCAAGFASFSSLSVYAIAMADSRKVTWMIVCHIIIDSFRLPALMKVFSRWIELMPMIAVASLTFSTEAFTWLSHSGSSGGPRGAAG